MPTPGDAAIVADTRRWLERAVIGLNLCPFAKAVHVKEQVHYAVTRARDWDGILADLVLQAHELIARTVDERETTLLIVADALGDFVEFTGLVAQAERMLDSEGLAGVLQLASFHPAFEFAGEAPGEMTHYTNRAPWPTLHLLREDSVARAVRAFPDAAAIYEENMRTLTALGRAGWDALDVGRSS